VRPYLLLEGRRLERAREGTPLGEKPETHARRLVDLAYPFRESRQARSRGWRGAQVFPWSTAGRAGSVRSAARDPRWRVSAWMIPRLGSNPMAVGGGGRLGLKDRVPVVEERVYWRIRATRTSSIEVGRPSARRPVRMGRALEQLVAPRTDVLERQEPRGPQCSRQVRGGGCTAKSTRATSRPAWRVGLAVFVESALHRRWGSSRRSASWYRISEFTRQQNTLLAPPDTHMGMLLRAIDQLFRASTR
jgi:hypothetical protein